ncbi:GSCOCG00012827001-RA-CDS [Cotesia congregata]|nr:GSCOCG00012827001-RA-CDS [Cotesia congregata]
MKIPSCSKSINLKKLFNFLELSEALVDVMNIQILLYWDRCFDYYVLTH